MGPPGRAGRRRARRPPSTTSWVARAPRQPRRARRAAPRRAGAAAAAAAAPPVEDVITAEQQARLAALEREAFTKGYAQGERAGLEAGGKRAEAMLRRVAQTLEELGGLRQTLIQETERQMVQLALTLARRVVHREVTLDPELAAALAHVALERARHDDAGDDPAATPRTTPSSRRTASAGAASR